MSEKRPSRGRGRGYRPNASEAVPPPSQEVVEDLLKDVHVGDAIADGMAGYDSSLDCLIDANIKRA